MVVIPQRCSSTSGRSPETSISSVPMAPSSTTQRSVAISFAIRAYPPALWVRLADAPSFVEMVETAFAAGMRRKPRRVGARPALSTG
jgi:hypothetical protein